MFYYPMNRDVEQPEMKNEQKYVIEIPLIVFYQGRGPIKFWERNRIFGACNNLVMAAEVHFGTCGERMSQEIVFGEGNWAEEQYDRGGGETY